MTKSISMNKILLLKLNDILEENLENEHFGVKELAREIGLSRSQLHRKLHALTRKSTSQYIREFRLDKAMEMLQDNVATASEIAYRVGFNSPTYFNTCFKDYFGYTPGEVKNHIQTSGNEREDFQRSYQIEQKQNPTSKSLLKKIFFRQRLMFIFFAGLLLIIAFSYYSYFGSNISTETLKTDVEIIDKSIAIIPFKNLSEHKEDEYFTMGVTSSLQNHLNNISDLRVIPETSMKKYENSTLNVIEISEEVNASYLLDGSVQKHRDSIRVIAHLINAKENRQITSMIFDWKYKNVFDIQHKIAEQVAEELNIKIKPKELESIEKIPTDNLEAYNLFLQAQFQAKKVNKKAYENAIPLYEKAIALDSTFVDAYYGLAVIWYQSGVFFGWVNQEESWAKAKAISEKVLQIDSTHIKLNDMLYFGYFIYDWNFVKAEKYYQSRLQSDDFGRTLGMDVDYPLKTGRYEEALKAIDYRIQKIPLSIWTYPYKAEALYCLNRKKEAIDILKSYDALYSDNLYYLIESAKRHFYVDQYEQSTQQLEILMRKFQDRPPIVLWLNALHEKKEGNLELVNNNLQDLEEKYTNKESGSPAWFLALYYCSIKDYEEAFKWLQRSFDQHEVEMIWLREEPLLKPLRNDQRYIDLYKKVGFPMKPHNEL